MVRSIVAKSLENNDLVWISRPIHLRSIIGAARIGLGFRRSGDQEVRQRHHHDTGDQIAQSHPTQIMVPIYLTHQAKI
jgi:hypothetical protein